jgi:hypothetical protein
MDAIDKEIRDIEERWAEEERERKQRAAEALRAFLEMRASSLRDGTWKPRHVCRKCLRAILTLSPQLCCDEAKKNGDQWWVRP